jgi:hypothetical protein
MLELLEKYFCLDRNASPVIMKWFHKKNIYICTLNQIKNTFKLLIEQ